MFYAKQLRALQGDRILILPAEEKMTAGGIIIPETVDEKPHYGLIIAVGPGDEVNRMPYIPGINVLYGKYAGTEMDMRDDNDIIRKYLIMRAQDVISPITPLEAIPELKHKVKNQK